MKLYYLRVSIKIVPQSNSSSSLVTGIESPDFKLDLKIYNALICFVYALYFNATKGLKLVKQSLYLFIPDSKR